MALKASTAFGDKSTKTLLSSLLMSTGAGSLELRCVFGGRFPTRTLCRTIYGCVQLRSRAECGVPRSWKPTKWLLIWCRYNMLFTTWTSMLHRLLASSVSTSPRCAGLLAKQKKKRRSLSKFDSWFITSILAIVLSIIIYVRYPGGSGQQAQRIKTGGLHEWPLKEGCWHKVDE